MSTPKTAPSPLLAWLADDRADKFFGQAFTVKFAVIAELATSDRRDVAAVLAKRLGVDRKAIAVHVRKCREIYGFAPPSRAAKKVCQS